jgi:hypothetical protein
MANDPPFATLNHVAGDLGIPSESALLRIGISPNEFCGPANATGCKAHAAIARFGKLPGQKIIRASRDGDPAYLAQRERVYDGTRKAGMPEE